MKTEHTPGPWILICVDGADFTAIATRLIPLGAMDLDAEVLGSSEWLRAEPADLRLMAAAPELLAALQAIRVLAPLGSMMRVEADAAIAKATGMSSNA